MITTLKTIVRPLKNKVISLYRAVVPLKQPIEYKLSYSYEGEDMILSLIFVNQANGYYVDVGAFHPRRYSNTYYFYLLGWKGINIDARPGSMEVFNKVRPNDINLEIPISDTKQTLTYYNFNEPQLNGFSEELSVQRDGWKVGDWESKLISKIQLETFTLAEVLDKYLPPNQAIDFMTIDVEGLDYQVLNSNNWEKYRPKIVLVEDLEMSLTTQNEAKIALFMREQGYELYSKIIYTFIFKRNDFKVR